MGQHGCQSALQTKTVPNFSQLFLRTLPPTSAVLGVRHPGAKNYSYVIAQEMFSVREKTVSLY